MRPSSRTISWVSNVFLVAALAGIWLVFAPTNIGGSTAYVIVEGNSMEPNLQRGDLAIVRKATTYQIGDVVTYRDNTLSAYVIHRIIGIEQNRFILQGDNNEWVDETKPTVDDLIGKLWIHIPKMGQWMQWLQIPLHFAIVTSLFGGILMTSSFSKPQNAQNRKTKNTPNYVEMSVYAGVVMLLSFLGLALFAFTRPTSMPASTVLYQQEGRFSYSATSIPGIYDGATITSGEPVFLSQTCTMNVNFSYTLINSELTNVTGNHQLYARVLHEASGWRRTIPINQQSSFSGNAFMSAGALDLCQVKQLVESLAQETGLKATNYKLQLIAPVLLSGTVAGQNITDSFFPTLTFKFDDVHFYLENDSRSEADFIFTKAGTNNGIISEQPSHVQFFGFPFYVETLRIISVAGLFFSLGILAIIGIYIYFLAQEDPQFLLRMKYSHLLVDVQGRTFEPTPPIIDIDSIETIAKLAERHNTVILHITHPFLHDYLVQTPQATYRYSIGRSEAPPAEEPSQQERHYLVNYQPQEPIIAQNPSERSASEHR